MLSLLQRASRSSSVARPCLCTHLVSKTRPSLSTTSARWSSTAPDPPTAEEEAELEAAIPELLVEEVQESPKEPLQVDEGRGGRSESLSYNEFLSRIGTKYKLARPRNWLGNDVPFPMNPSFKPPPPLSDALRQQIYKQYMSDPKKNSIRALSQQYHLSLKRVDAILRLKGLEHAWYKVTASAPINSLNNTDHLLGRRLLIQEDKEIQYGFQKGMEKLLGVQSHKAEKALKDGSRWDVTEADQLEQDENRDAQRQRYQRHYWESVPEGGREPIVPASLEHAKDLAQKLVKFEEHMKSTHPRLMPRFVDTRYIKTPTEKVRLLERPGRPTIEIRDVGGRFVNLNDRLKRIAMAERRAREIEKKNEKKKSAILASSMR